MLTLRPVTLKDADILLDWRNDLETRAQSRNTDLVAREGHVAWLEKTVSGAVPSRKLYIAEDNGTPIGTVRSDIHDDVVELSWTVAPASRGKGFGKAMVLQFVKEVHPAARLVASIRTGNIASEKIAQALGLHQAEPEFPNDTLMMWR